MKNLNVFTVFMLIAMCLLGISCSAIGAIFKTGMGVGIFIAVVVIVIIVAIVLRSGKK